MRNPFADRDQKHPPFSKKWFWDHFQTLFWVALVTVMIWIYADMEFTDTAKINLKLKFTVGAKTEYRLLSSETASVEVEISGAKSALDDFRKTLASKGGTLELDVTRFGAINDSIPTREIVEQAGELHDLGISVKSATPQSLPVVLETLEKVDHVLVSLSTIRGSLDTAPKPVEISILVPASEKEKIIKLRDSNKLELKTALVDLSKFSEEQMAKVSAEVMRTIQVGDKSVQIVPQPAVVDFKIDIKWKFATKEIKVPIEILTPASWASAEPASTWQKYKLVRPSGDLGWSRTIKISGPKKQVANKAALSKKVRAFVVLTDDDKKKLSSWSERTVEIIFTDKEAGLKLVGVPPKVKLRLEERSASPVSP